MTGSTFTISSWQELAVIVGIVSAVAGVIGGVIRSRLDKKSAEAAASDRLIRLIETEADKRVAVVRTEFELKMANLQLAHRQELEALRATFERELQELRDSQKLVCTVAGCAGRIVTTSTRRPTRARSGQGGSV